MPEAEAGWTCERLVPADVGNVDRSRWAGLCAGSDALASPFLSFGFVDAVARCGGHVMVAIIRRGRDAVAFFPFQQDGPLLRALGSAQRVGGHLSDCFGVVAEPGLYLAPETLLRLAGLNAVHFDHLPASQARFGLSGEQIDRGVRMPLRRDGEAYWAAQRRKDKSFATDLKRREKRVVETLGPLRFDYRSDRPEQALRQLVECKRAQYRRTGARDALRSESSRMLLRRLLSADDPQCTGVLSVLHAGDTWVAAHFGLRHGGLLHWWFPVYNEALAQHGPGHLLLKQIVDRAGHFDIDCIDRGAGMQRHKTRYVVEEVIYQGGCWRTGTFAARLCELERAARWRLERLDARLRRATTGAVAPASASRPNAGG